MKFTIIWHPNFRERFVFFFVLTLAFLTACSTGISQTVLTDETDDETTEMTQVSVLPGKATSTADPQPAITSVPLGIETDDLQGVAVQFWHPWTQEAAIVIESLVDQFNTVNPHGIVVTARGESGNLYQNVQEGIRTGKVPDVAVGLNYQIQSWDNNGNFISDLDVYVRDPVWGLTEAEIADFSHPRWDQDMFKGKRLGLPAQTSAAVLFYNRSWAQELGFDSPPNTPTEFKEQACAAAAVSINTALSVDGASSGIGGWIASTDPGSLMGWVLGFEENGVNESGDGYAFDTPGVGEAFAFIKSLFKSGCAWVPENRFPVEEFASRKGLFSSSDILSIPYQRSAFEVKGSVDEWVPIPYPGVDGKPAINLYGPTFAILKTTPEQQLATWLFIKWMTQPENQVLLSKATGYLPTRATAFDLMDDYARVRPQWEAAWNLTAYSRVEPGFGSWVVARWALSDAAAELISSEFSSERINPLLKELDALLAEIHIQSR
jgi:ABC-type glycerol-3-phosphate transport system substrate-binding protein